MRNAVRINDAALQRHRRELVRLAHAGQDTETLLDETVRILGEAIPCEAGCWHSLDPATLIETSYRAFNLPLENPLAAEIEYLHEDYNQFASLVRAPLHSAILSVATGGLPERSLRYRELLLPMGLPHELRSAFVDDAAGWGSICLLRKRSSGDFDAREASLLEEVASHLGHGLRAATLLRAASSRADETTAPGLVLLDERHRLDSMNAAAERWLAALASMSPGAADERALPYVVHAVAAKARVAGDDSRSSPARARVTTARGVSIVLHGCRMRAGGQRRIAVVLEPERPLELAPPRNVAPHLTPREGEVAMHLLQGYSTKQIARSLGISPYTVQEHCTAIFDKAGVRSRRELVGTVFRRLQDPRNAS
ncbi:MAG: LuxR C-terminal-related transcriptional regulator [Burkholderiaceae bacterium]|jgi:DNA-binding CsgD family transcriptional regulator|nr:LuxR C-terminal-related transcriptional regulator [Burkholderiaceae bacterium]